MQAPGTESCLEKLDALSSFPPICPWPWEEAATSESAPRDMLPRLRAEEGTVWWACKGQGHDRARTWSVELSPHSKVCASLSSPQTEPVCLAGGDTALLKLGHPCCCRSTPSLSPSRLPHLEPPWDNILGEQLEWYHRKLYGLGRLGGNDEGWVAGFLQKVAL